MLHARPDYNRIQDPAGLIPKDEPVFLLRAQDELAAATVSFWCDLANKKNCDEKIIDMARKWADKMRQWPRKKLPDLIDVHAMISRVVMTNPNISNDTINMAKALILRLSNYDNSGICVSGESGGDGADEVTVTSTSPAGVVTAYNVSGLEVVREQ